MACRIECGILSDEGYSSLCDLHYDSVTALIDMFLKDKPHKMKIWLHEATDRWPEFWDWIGAEGDFKASLAEWGIRHNKGPVPGKGEE